MPPVLSKGGAASKLSATEPASVLAPSPETNCQQTASQVSQRDETNTQEERTHLKDADASGQQTHVRDRLCLHFTAVNGWVEYPILMTLPKGLSAFMDDNVWLNGTVLSFLLQAHSSA